MSKRTPPVPAGADRLTTKVAVLGVLLLSPSLRLTLLIDSVGGWVVAGPSSFWIVARPVRFWIVALVGLLRLTVKVSFGSAVVSPLTATVTALDVSPGANVSVVSGTAA